jgi:SnoaL-like domain
MADNAGGTASTAMSAASSSLPRMVELRMAPDCGNAPKRALLRDYAVALADRNLADMLSVVSDDVEWEVVGSRRTGKDGFSGTVDRLLAGEVADLTLHSVLTHGDEGCVTGVMRMTDGRRIRFCDVYKFTGHSKSAKIKTITSFTVEVTAG